MAAKQARPELELVAPPTRTEIKIDVEIDRMTIEAIAALAHDAETFQRGGALVHVAHTSADEVESKRAPIALDAPVIREMGRATLRSRMSRSARWLRIDGRSKEWRETTPPENVVGAVHERGAWSGVRPLVGVITAPTIRPDGSILQARGYDAATGYVYLPSTKFPNVSPSPSLEDARDALKQLEDVFADFPFVDAAASSVPIAAILTILARPAIDGAVPAFLVDASNRGSGKTLAATVISEVTTGRDAARASWPPEEEEELEKILGSYALRGASLIVFDNIPTTTPFAGGPLDRVLTARDTVESRVLGRSEVPTMPWRAVILATGNNIDVRGDTTRRVLIARIESEMERPETRTGFRHADLIAHVRNARPRLVVAALTVLRAFVVAGRPDQGTGTWGSFESWARLVPPAIVLAGGADPMRARPASDAEHDPETRALALILESLARFDRDGRGVTVKELVAELYPGGRAPEDGRADGNDELRDAIEQLAPSRGGLAPSTSSLAGRFRAARRRPINGRRLVMLHGRSGVSRWGVEVIGGAR